MDHAIITNVMDTYFQQYKINIVIYAFIVTFYCIEVNAQNNYQYDEQGRLRADLSEDIQNIVWNDANKIARIERTDTSTAADMEFAYDVGGYRVMKLVKPRTGDGLAPETQWHYTYYEYDPLGQLVAVYNRFYLQEDGETFSEVIEASQNHLMVNTLKAFVYHQERMFNRRRFTASLDGEGRFMNIQELSNDSPITASSSHTVSKGFTHYSLGDHTGNVKKVINDRKTVDPETLVRHANVEMASDYYPFGATLPGRHYSSDRHAYGYQGSIKDDEVKGSGQTYSTYYRELYTDIGRWWSVDPKAVPWESPYASMANNPILFNDVLGDIVKGDLESYGKVKSHVQGQIDYYSARLSGLNKRRNAARSKGMKKMYSSWIKHVERKKSTWDVVVKELTALENSEQVYNIVTGAEPLKNADGTPAAVGYTTFNKDTWEIDVVVTNLTTIMRTLPHELKHAYQFENEDIDFEYENGTYVQGTLSDAWDEAEAFQQEAIFAGSQGSEITADWVRANKKEYKTLSPKKTSLNDDKGLAFFFPNTHTVYFDGVYGRLPTRVFKNWQRYYRMGQEDAANGEVKPHGPFYPIKRNPTPKYQAESYPH